MDKVSPFGAGGQQYRGTPPDVLPFDAAGTDDTAGADDDSDPGPGPAASAALVIRCPRGHLVSSPGYTVYAVEFGEDGEGGEEVRCAQPLSGKSRSLASARLDCAVAALDRGAIHIPATHVVVNDHLGRERHRLPLLRVA